MQNKLPCGVKLNLPIDGAASDCAVQDDGHPQSQAALPGKLAKDDEIASD
jgi:hypothetical protein